MSAVPLDKRADDGKSAAHGTQLQVVIVQNEFGRRWAGSQEGKAHPVADLSYGDRQAKEENNQCKGGQHDGAQSIAGFLDFQLKFRESSAARSARPLPRPYRCSCCLVQPNLMPVHLLHLR